MWTRVTNDIDAKLSALFFVLSFVFVVMGDGGAAIIAALGSVVFILLQLLQDATKK